jgi:hypothetical protein
MALKKIFVFMALLALIAANPAARRLLEEEMEEVEVESFLETSAV